MKTTTPTEMIGKTVLGFYYEDRSDNHLYIICDDGIGYQFYPLVDGFDSNWKGFNSFSVNGLENLLYSKIIAVDGHSSSDENGYWSAYSSLWFTTDKGECWIRFSDTNYRAYGDEGEYSVSYYDSCCKFKLEDATWLSNDWEKTTDFED